MTWNEFFGGRDIVVCNKDDFHQVADIAVVVDLLAHGTNEFDDAFGHIITRCSFASDDTNAGNDVFSLRWRHLFDLIISPNNATNIQKLSFVFVNTFNLKRNGFGCKVLEKRLTCMSSMTLGGIVTPVLSWM